VKPDTGNPAPASSVPRRGEIYYVDLDPVVGSEQGGIRPGLVIQNDISNERSPVVIVAIITSRMASRSYPYDVRITPDESALPRLSRVMLNQIRTVDKRRLGERVGALSAERMAAVDDAIRVSLGLIPLS
jgi:mRNA interferase MazF